MFGYIMRGGVAPTTNNILKDLGFEEGELEMFFDVTNISNQQLINRYLNIAREPPYNLNWRTQQQAINANYNLGVFGRNRVEYTKHDIASDTLNSFYEEDNGLAQGIRKKKRKTGKNKRRTNKRRTNKKRK